MEQVIFDKFENENIKTAIVSLASDSKEEEDMMYSLDELERLVETAGGKVVVKMTQIRATPDPATYIGRGKVEELNDLCKTANAALVVFDTELSPSQIRNIEDALEDDVRVIDRSMLILDIFALHAGKGEAKIQVELAQLKYTSPRLTGRGIDMSRLGGGIGTRGPGETQLETERRHIKRRIEALSAKLERIRKTGETMRRDRKIRGVTKISLVGYTNAGKSTFLNALTDAGVVTCDRLFTTLMPRARKFTLPCGENVVLTDTVGFIRNIPVQLIEAFRSTLDEVREADIILVLVDVSDKNFAKQTEVSDRLLVDLGAGEKPRMYLFNKCDIGIADKFAARAAGRGYETAYISALRGDGIPAFLSKLEKIVLEKKHLVRYFFKNDDLSGLDLLYGSAVVKKCDYTAKGVAVTAAVGDAVRGRLADYEVKSKSVHV